FGCNPMSHQKHQQKQPTQQNKVIYLKMVNSNTVKIDGKTIPFSNAEAVLTNIYKNHPNTEVHIKIGKNAPVKLLNKSQRILQKAGALRINYSVKQSKNHHANNPQKTTLKRRNVLTLYINTTGDVFVKHNRASLSSVKGLVKKFITNNGKADNLSQSPQKAIISVKTDPETPLY